MRRIASVPLCRRAASWLQGAGPEASRIASDVEPAAALLLATLETAGPVVGLCHGDACLLNAAFDGGRVTFFDFGECASRLLALDLASMAVWLRPEPDRAALWAELLDGYRSRRPLSPGDIVALPALVLFSGIRVAASVARYHSMAPEHWTELGRRVGSRLDDLRAAVSGETPELLDPP